MKVEEAGEEVSNLVRIRNMRDVGFDSRWHRLSIDENLNITLQT